MPGTTKTKPDHGMMTHELVCSGGIVVTTLDCGPEGSWSEVSSRCLYSMRLD